MDRKELLKKKKIKKRKCNTNTCNRRKLMWGHLWTPTITRRNHNILLAGAKTRTPMWRATHVETIVVVLVGRWWLHAWPRVHWSYATGRPIPGSTHLPRGAGLSHTVGPAAQHLQAGAWRHVHAAYRTAASSCWRSKALSNRIRVWSIPILFPAKKQNDVLLKNYRHALKACIRFFFFKDEVSVPDT